MVRQRIVDRVDVGIGQQLLVAAVAARDAQRARATSAPRAASRDASATTSQRCRPLSGGITFSRAILAAPRTPNLSLRMSLPPPVARPDIRRGRDRLVKRGPLGLARALTGRRCGRPYAARMRGNASTGCAGPPPPFHLRPARAGRARSPGGDRLAAWERGIAPLVPGPVLGSRAGRQPFRPFLRHEARSVVVADLGGEPAGLGRPRRRQRLYQRSLGGAPPRGPRRRFGAARGARGGDRPERATAGATRGADRQPARPGPLPPPRLPAGVGGAKRDLTLWASSCTRPA